MSQKTCPVLLVNLCACGNPIWKPYSYCYEHMMAYSYCDPDAGRDAQREREVEDRDYEYLNARYGRDHIKGG